MKESDATEDTRVISELDVEANSTVDGQLASQSAEAIFDKTFQDTYWTARRTLKLKLEALTRLLYQAKINEFLEKNKRGPTMEEELDIMDKVRKLPILQEILKLKANEDHLSNVFTAHPSDPENAWNHIMYEDLPKIEELDITVSMMLEPIVPLKKPPTPGDVIRRRVADAIAEDMEDDSDA